MAALLLIAFTQAPPMVDVAIHIPDAIVALKYATADNFVGRRLYPAEARCLLVPAAAQRLAKAASQLRRQGFRLVLYDCFRPAEVQLALWKANPQPGYVAAPLRGSMHSRGICVDVALATRDGRKVPMPSAYDAFEVASHQGYDGGTAASRSNRDRLRHAMTEVGFATNPKEWWHYALPISPLPPLRAYWPSRAQ